MARTKNPAPELCTECGEPTTGGNCGREDCPLEDLDMEEAVETVSEHPALQDVRIDEVHEDGSLDVIMPGSGTEVVRYVAAESVLELMPDPPNAEAAEGAFLNLTGRFTSLVIDCLKTTPKSWQQLAEAEQTWEIDRIGRRVDEAVRPVIEGLATRGFDRVRLSIEKVEFSAKGGKVTATASRYGDGIHELADRAGGDVIVVLCDANEFLGGALPEPDDDQGDMFTAADDAGEATEGEADGAGDVEADAARDDDAGEGAAEEGTS